jgi:hypothetical protein
MFKKRLRRASEARDTDYIEIPAEFGKKVKLPQISQMNTAKADTD